MLTKRSLSSLVLSLSLIGSAAVGVLTPAQASADDAKHKGSDPYSCATDAKNAKWKAKCTEAKVATYKDVQNVMKAMVKAFKDKDKTIGDLEAKCVSCHNDGAGLKGLKDGADKHFDAMLSGPK